MGVGNQTSCEFELIYRWHAAISAKDDEWTQGFMKSIFPGKDISKLTLQEFRLGFFSWLNSIPRDPSKRRFGGLQRGPDGRFDDAALVQILTEATEDCAGTCSYNGW